MSTRTARHALKNGVDGLGASSGAGKSLLATALCAAGPHAPVTDVAPSGAEHEQQRKRVVPLSAHPAGEDSGGGELAEIGAAQYFQALAARIQPHVI
ncbi:MAG: hypothetical protein H7A15_01975 [Sinobacteraceae bacterium]|nr:hypothetical protein [Nevskiaceae bacterium]